MGLQPTPEYYSRTNSTIPVADIKKIANATAGVDGNSNKNGHSSHNYIWEDTCNANQRDRRFLQWA